MGITGRDRRRMTAKDQRRFCDEAGHYVLGLEVELELTQTHMGFIGRDTTRTTATDQRRFCYEAGHYALDDHMSWLRESLRHSKPLGPSSK